VFVTSPTVGRQENQHKTVLSRHDRYSPNFPPVISLKHKITWGVFGQA